MNEILTLKLQIIKMYLKSETPYQKISYFYIKSMFFYEEFNFGGSKSQNIHELTNTRHMPFYFGVLGFKPQNWGFEPNPGDPAELDS